MSEQGPPSGTGGSGKPPGEPAARKHLNGHSVPLINGSGKTAKAQGEEPRAGESVVVPFPKKKKTWPVWLGAVLGWISLLGFAGLVWGISKDGRVDVTDIGAGLVGVFAALWFYRTR
jgi:hypothetical protein